MAFLDAFRRRLQQPADLQLDDETRQGMQRLGYGGGGVALDTPQGQVLTPQNQAVITRPRTVTQSPDVPAEGQPVWTGGGYVSGSPGYRNLPPQQGQRSSFPAPQTPFPTQEVAQPQDTMAPPEAGRQRAVSFDPQTGKPNEAFYRDRGDAQGLYNAEVGWTPHGAKRGFKNSLKAGAMMAAEAVRNNPHDPVTAAIAGFGAGALGATAAPNFKNRLTRDWKIQQTGGELQDQLKLAGEQAKIGALTNKPGLQQETLTEREANNALTQYNRLEHYDPEDPADAGWKKYFESRGMTLPKKDKYHRPIVTRTDDGRIIVTGPGGSQDMQVGGQTVTDTARTPTETQIGDQTFRLPQKQAAQITAQTTTAAANREATAARQRERLDARVPSTPKSGGPAPDRATSRHAAKLIGQMETARKAMEQADAALGANPNDSAAKETRVKAQQAGEGWAAELNALGAGYEAGPGEKGFPYYKRTGTPQGQSAQSGRTIDGATKAFTKKVGRPPTADELARMRAALGQ